MLSATDLKTGKIYKEDNKPLLVVKYTHVKTARGGATIKVKTKNILTGEVLEKSYNSSASLEEADVMRKNAQYLYKTQNVFVFMDPVSYEQFELSADLLEGTSEYLKDGDVVQMLFFEGNPVSVDLPNSVIFEVVYTEPGYKGNTVSNVLKDARAANGAVFKVPTFIKIGDKIKIDTRTGEYISKA